MAKLAFVLVGALCLMAIVVAPGDSWGAPLEVRTAQAGDCVADDPEGVYVYPEECLKYRP